jgi:hypothetical protein
LIIPHRDGLVAGVAGWIDTLQIDPFFDHRLAVSVRDAARDDASLDKLYVHVVSFFA